MGKTESTAVNALIELVQTSKPVVDSEDLMFAPPPKASRVTQTVPPTMSGAGEVAPLPRHRTPIGTQQNMPSIPPTVRVSPAPVRTMTIPPVVGRPAEGTPAPQLFSQSRPSAVMRATLPPPVRTTPPPASMPVAAPFASSTPVRAASAAPEMTSNQMWFDADDVLEEDRSDAIIRNPASSIEGTDKLAKGTSTLSLIGKLAMPTLGLAIVGVFVGGYIAFDGAGGGSKKPANQPGVAASLGDLGGTQQDTKPEAAKPLVAPPSDVDPNAAKADDGEAQAGVATGAPAEAALATTEQGKGDEAVAKPSVVDPAVAAAAAPAPLAIATATTSMVDVRIDSQPSGATVMLVDRGKTTFLGTTPIATAVDPSRSYDIVFTYADKPTQLEHLDPTSTKHLSVILGKAGNRAEGSNGLSAEKNAATAAKVDTKAADAAKLAQAKADADAAKLAKAEAAKATKAAALPTATKTATAKAPAKKVAKVADPGFGDTIEKPAVAKPAVAATPAAGGDGVLMVSSKPPCAIFVDGKDTGLMTPQRALKLSAGKHTITLVSPDKTLKKSVAVQITADKPTKLIQDLMK